MHLSDSDITHLGKLTRLKLTAEQRHLFAEQLSAVLDYLDQINQSDIRQTGVWRREPVVPFDFREDVAKPADDQHIISQAPVRDGSLVVSHPTV